jgi:hypothetical protein
LHGGTDEALVSALAHDGCEARWPVTTERVLREEAGGSSAPAMVIASSG